MSAHINKRIETDAADGEKIDEPAAFFFGLPVGIRILRVKPVVQGQPEAEAFEQQPAQQAQGQDQQAGTITESAIFAPDWFMVFPASFAASRRPARAPQRRNPPSPALKNMP